MTFEFCTNHPFAVLLPVQEFGESVLERLDGTGKLKLSLVEGVFQFFQKEPPEKACEHANRRKEARQAGDPALVIGREAPAGNDTVQMRMMQKILSPGMQNGEEANACAQMFRVAGNGEQGFGSGVEQDVVNRLLVAEGDPGDLVRHRENHVEVFHW
jgi:hypothetical protein